MEKINTIADIYRSDEDPNDWVVWALHPDGDAAASTAVFSGPEAMKMALEYAETKYQGQQRRDWHQPTYRYDQRRAGDQMTFLRDRNVILPFKNDIS